MHESLVLVVGKEQQNTDISSGDGVFLGLFEDFEAVQLSGKK